MPILKKSDEIRCINIYEKFLKMGEDKFHERYPAYPIMDKCMSLFHESSFIQAYDPAQIEDVVVKQSNSNILSSQKIGNEKFLVKFNICSDENQKSNKVLIVTDKESIVGKAYRTLPDQCQTFWVDIFARDSSNVQFSWYYDVSNHKMERKMF